MRTTNLLTSVGFLLLLGLAAMSFGCGGSDQVEASTNEAQGEEQDVAQAGDPEPTAMLVGDQDSLAPTNLADFQRLPNATLHVFSGTGHMFFHEVPDAAAAVIDDFLRSGVRRPAPLPEPLQAAAT